MSGKEAKGNVGGAGAGADSSSSSSKKKGAKGRDRYATRVSDYKTSRRSRKGGAKKAKLGGDSGAKKAKLGGDSGAKKAKHVDSWAALAEAKTTIMKPIISEPMQCDLKNGQIGVSLGITSHCLCKNSTAPLTWWIDGPITIGLQAVQCAICPSCFIRANSFHQEAGVGELAKVIKSILIPEFSLHYKPANREQTYRITQFVLGHEKFTCENAQWTVTRA